MVQTFKLSIVTVAHRGAARHAVRDRDRPLARPPARAANFTMLLSFVVPEIILGVSLYILFTNLLPTSSRWARTRSCSGSSASRSAIRSSSCARGCSRSGPSTRRPRWTSARRRARRSGGCCCRCCARRSSRASRWCSPTRVDDFVTVRYLSGASTASRWRMKIYSAARSSPTPAVNAAATMMLITTLLVIGGGLLFYKRMQPGPGDGRRRGVRRSCKRTGVTSSSSSDTSSSASSQDRACRPRAAPAALSAGSAP